MSNALELNSFEQLDLRLAMLVANQQRSEGAQGILQPLDSDQDYRPHLETTRRIIQEIQQVFESSAEEPPDELLQVLNRAAVLAESLRQLPSLSLQQFESFGFFICRWVKSFRESHRAASDWRRLSREERIRPLRGSFQAVDDRSLQGRLEEVFGRLIYGLCLMRHSQQALETCQDRQQLILMMVRCNECAQGVLAEMEKLQRAAGASRTDLGEVLSWSSCALKLEVRRVLKGDLHHLDAEVNSDSCCERLDRAIGILLNGFDHTIRHLLNCFDPAFDGGGILGDLREQYREACRLREGLEALKEAVKKVEESPSQRTRARLRQAVQGFAGHAFPSLYLRDRRVIEEFAQQVEDSEQQELPAKAHQFQTFLSTLLGEVKNRSIFAQFEQQSFVA